MCNFALTQAPVLLQYYQITQLQSESLANLAGFHCQRGVLVLCQASCNLRTATVTAAVTHQVALTGTQCPTQRWRWAGMMCGVCRSTEHQHNHRSVPHSRWVPCSHAVNYVEVYVRPPLASVSISCFKPFCMHASC